MQRGKSGCSDSQSDPAVLEVEGLRTEIHLGRRVLPAVNGVSLRLRPRESLAVVGESGCGKSMMALSIMRLVPDPPARIVAGSVRLAGTDLLTLSPRQMRRLRGSNLAMVFQEPMTSINPVRTVGSQLIEAITTHQRFGNRAARDRAQEMLRLVGIPDARVRMADYPHNLSGGMRQRVMIAMALSSNPRVLLMDEPTTALDVTVQAQIMNLIAELRDRLGTAIILITHDLSLAAENCDRVLVLYCGYHIEEAPVEQLFRTPLHPYTKGLLDSIPLLEIGSISPGVTGERPRLREIKGVVPALDALPPGCPYAARCPLASGECHIAMPPLELKRPDHFVACWHSDRLERLAV